MEIYTRRVLFEDGHFSCTDTVAQLDNPIGDELLRPTRIYVKSILNLIKNFNVRGIVHITGGGFLDNIPRIVPGPCRAVIKRDVWAVPPIFDLIQKTGKIEDIEMFRVFNMGIGMILIVSEKDQAEVMERLETLGEKAYLLGLIEKRESHQLPVSFL